MDMTTAVTMDVRLVEPMADLKEPTLVVLLVIASVVWTEESTAAWSAARWAGSTVAQMDEHWVELRVASKDETTAVERVLA